MEKTAEEILNLKTRLAMVGNEQKLVIVYDDAKNAMEEYASQFKQPDVPDEAGEEWEDETDLAKLFKPYCMDYFSKEPDNVREKKVKFAFDNKDKAFELFQSLYDTNYGTITIEGNLISIHTGGWSDNEEIISYFKKTFWWQTNLRLQATGGHYYFDTDGQNDNEWVINKSLHPSQFKQPSAWISVEDKLKDVIDKARVYNGGWVFTEAEIIDEFIKTSK